MLFKTDILFSIAAIISALLLNVGSAQTESGSCINRDFLNCAQDELEDFLTYSPFDRNDDAFICSDSCAGAYQTELVNLGCDTDPLFVGRINALFALCNIDFESAECDNDNTLEKLTELGRQLFCKMGPTL